ncbi:hypothetical protein DB346_20705 [Verrucomicrobia bacterium LW23]|nr:hypothetical protein DB346_20705 [Verrucomicrobia bacterium LW23]
MPADPRFFARNLDTYGRILRITIGLLLFNLGVGLAAFSVHWAILGAIFVLSVAALAEAVFCWSPLNAWMGIPMPTAELEFSSGAKRRRGDRGEAQRELEATGGQAAGEAAPMRRELENRAAAGAPKSRRQDKFRRRHHYNRARQKKQNDGKS